MRSPGCGPCSKFKFRTIWQMFTEFVTNIMPVETPVASYFLHTVPIVWQISELWGIRNSTATHLGSETNVW